MRILFQSKTRNADLTSLLLVVLAVPGGVDRHWAPEHRHAQEVLERRLDRVPDPSSLRHWHELLASEVHDAGSPGDLRVAERIASAFEEMGLEVERQEVLVYLPRPLGASLEITAPVHLGLPLREEPIPEDPYSSAPGLPIGWNAYSGSGSAEGRVVYANYGRLEDFAELSRMGVDLRGAIVVARYGGNFRGYKAKFAEEAGAAGLVIYTDPADSGWARGLMYPEGGYANPSSIQRGSILTLPYRGDPLTPFEPATPGAHRLDPSKVPLPRIPVQPVGWEAAREILSRMRGAPVPDGWQGGLPFTYRVEGGPELRVSLDVRQERRLVRTVNVVGTLRGVRFPDQMVIFGSHHDAWVYGAGDPTAGTILVLEAARSFARAARKGSVPARSVLFAAWAAEEYGIIGSVEWVEAHRRELEDGAVAYINADMAAMGPEFHASADPFLKEVLAGAAADVPQPGGKGSVLDAWLARGEDPDVQGAPLFGDLGGGSDHVGFYGHLAVPSAGIEGSGSKGTSYHSVYDDLHWYRKVVGDDYAPALALTRIADRALARLAGADLPPLDPVRPTVDLRRHLAAVADRAAAAGLDFHFTRLEAVSTACEERVRALEERLLDSFDSGRLTERQVERAALGLLRLPRAWLHEEGLANRPWFRNLYAAPDETSGYAPWMLPALVRAVEDGDREEVTQAQELYVGALRRMESDLETAVGPAPERHPAPAAAAR